MSIAPLRQWETAVDRQIREAQERGDFDNLPGRGKPLPTGGWQGGDWALAYHVLKQAGETLPWIALGRDIEAAQARLRALLREAPRSRGPHQARARERYLREAAALDKLLEEYAFIVPVRHLERGRLPPHVAAAQFDQAVRPSG
ncbi:MAG TPA: DnaJ family domain-containing protein [Chloroflexota bacterium]